MKQLVLVTWDDAYVDTGWSSVENVMGAGDVLSAMECVSVGWLLHYDGRRLTLAGTRGIRTDQGTALETNQRITIPRSWLQEIKLLGCEHTLFGHRKQPCSCGKVVKSLGRKAPPPSGT